MPHRPCRGNSWTSCTAISPEGPTIRILYVFPHPDDESFDPAPGIARQLREGHEVHLLTLTRGGATRQRHRLGLSVEEMGRVRLGEMREVERVLGLTSMTVLDLPDSGLAEMDPREIEEVVRAQIHALDPEVVVTYAVHGVSGFHDHLVTHAVVKRVYCELRDLEERPRRLALFTLAEVDEGSGHGGEETAAPLHTSPTSAIDVSQALSDSDLAAGRSALDCYRTYQEVIREADPLKRVGSTLHFELFQESYDPQLPSMTAGL